MRGVSPFSGFTLDYLSVVETELVFPRSGELNFVGGEFMVLLNQDLLAFGVIGSETNETVSELLCHTVE